jgi:hypothetical protein
VCFASMYSNHYDDLHMDVAEEVEYKPRAQPNVVEFQHKLLDEAFE